MVTKEVMAVVLIEEEIEERAEEGVDLASMELLHEMLTNDAPKQHIILVDGEPFTIMALMEALLFVADGPIEINQLAKMANVDSETIYQELQQLDQQYQTYKRGLRVQEYNGKFQLVTCTSFAPLIETFLNLDLNTKLSTPALETLAIVAYRQPITRAQIEAVRGVDSSAILRSLVQRALIQESGRLEGVGRPILYSVTETFMNHFGLTSLNELPTLETTEADTLWAATMLAENQAA